MRTLKAILTLASCLILLSGLPACTGGGDTADTGPVADAGPAQNVATGSHVALDGSGSTAANGDPLNYLWSFTSQPNGSAASLLDETTTSPTFTADADGTYGIQLLVSDGTKTGLPDIVTITAFTPPAPVPDTGQTTCRDVSGAVISCTGTGHDGEFSVNPMSYTDHGDGTITDNVTGLIWQKCSAGLKNDPACSGTALTCNWYAASGTFDAIANPDPIDVCGSLTLGNYSDWRLPDETELAGIVDYGVDLPAINATYFPNTTPLMYWSSTTYVYVPTGAWSMDFSSGSDPTFYNKANYNHSVRCVRGSAPPARSYTDNDNGTVTDNNTGLMWQMCSAGLNNDASCSGTVLEKMPWFEAIDYCNGLSLGGYSDWRLPDIKELRSIADNSMSGPAIDEAYFPNTNPSPTSVMSSFYWSSTFGESYWPWAWGVIFAHGSIDASDKVDGRSVRCVR